jgi:hypothetical protein
LKRGAETRRRRKADQAWLEMKCSCELYVHVCTSMY